MRYQTLPHWLEWQQTLHPKAIDMSLARISSVAEALGLSDSDLNCEPVTLITVGGTNGKGSCVRTLEQLLLAQGKAVGAFTSPHVLEYNERVRLNGASASDADFLRAFDAIDRARGDISLTYFEFSTLAAAWLFRDFNCEYWLLEVGLGGRLDSVNIWSADLAIVTSIDLDHIEWLGDNRESIGTEKAGIFRPGQLAICADPNPPSSIGRQAERLGTRLHQIGKDFSYTLDESSERFSWVMACDGSASNKALPVAITCSRPNLPLPSVAAALTGFNLLGVLDADRAQELLPELSLPGRFQRITYREKPLILDVAHNGQACELLAQRLESAVPKRRAAVFAAMADKDLPRIINTMAPLIDTWYLVDLNDTPRAAKPSAVAALVEQGGGQCVCSGNTADALERLCPASHGSTTASPRQAENSFYDEVVVFGSFYTVEAALRAINSGD